MAEAQWDVVFYGKLLPGFQRKSVEEEFAKRTAFAEEIIQKIFSADRVTIKRNLEQSTAQKYKSILNKIGMVIELESQSDSPKEAQNSSIEQSQEETPAGANTEPQAAQEDTVAEPATAPSMRQMEFSFTGNGREYFKIWIVNIILTVITLGFYSPWAKVRNKQYFYGNTWLDESSFSYLADPIKLLKGRVIAVVFFIIFSLASNFSPILSLVMGLLLLAIFPWFIVRSLAFNAHYSCYRNVTLRFKGKTPEAAKVFILFPFLALLTIGILGPYAYYRQQRFLLENHCFGTTPFTFHGKAKDYYKILGFIMLGALVALGLAMVTGPVAPLLIILAYFVIFAYFVISTTNLRFNNTNIGAQGFSAILELKGFSWLLITNTLGLVFTLGLFYPWAAVRTARYKAEHIQFIADGDLNTFVAAEEEQINALGEEVGEVFDFDIGL